MRFQKLDILRGIAIILMVAFHANYLLVHFFGNTALNISILWYIAGKFSVILFLFVSGVSFFLSIQGKTKQEIRYKSLKRALFLTIIAAGISIVTFFFARSEFITFGIIHLFAAISLLSPLFMRFRVWNVLIGMLIIAIGVWFSKIYVDNGFLFFLGLRSLTFSSGDYYPVFPWFWVMLVGYGIASLLSRKDRLQKLLSWEISWGKILWFMGRNALIIYIIHVPILYAIFLTFR